MTDQSIRTTTVIHPIRTSCPFLLDLSLFATGPCCTPPYAQFPVEIVFTILEAGCNIHDLTQFLLSVSLVNRSWLQPASMLLFPSRPRGFYWLARCCIAARKEYCAIGASAQRNTGPGTTSPRCLQPLFFTRAVSCLNFQVPATLGLTCYSRSKSTLTH
jgi:hypothetical protein